MVASKAAAIQQKDQLLVEAHQGMMVRQFLMALELHRKSVGKLTP